MHPVTVALCACMNGESHHLYYNLLILGEVQTTAFLQVALLYTVLSALVMAAVTNYSCPRNTGQL